MEWDYIYRYTRKQAIEDGVLVDLTPFTKEAGYKVPVAVTATVWHRYLNPSSELQKEGQSWEGRTWDMLMVLRTYIQQTKDTDTIHFPVLFLMDDGMEAVPLKAIIHGGDEGEPVLTIMLKNED